MHKHEYADLLAEGWLPPEEADKLRYELAVRRGEIFPSPVESALGIPPSRELLDRLRKPHPDQARIDAESAALLRQTAWRDADIAIKEETCFHSPGQFVKGKVDADGNLYEPTLPGRYETDYAKLEPGAGALVVARLPEFVCPECGLTTVINRCPKCDWDGDTSPAEE